MYGQTEASPRISFISFPDISEEPDSIGKAIHGCDILTSDNNEVITSPYVTGELNVKDNIALGYSTSYEQLAEKDLFGGHLKTGDLAYFNQNGLFFVNGRKKRFVKLFGKRINLDDGRSISGYGLESVCTGDDILIKVGCVGISPQEGQNLVKKLMSKLGLPNTAFKVYKLDKIERLASGKIAYQANNKKMRSRIMDSIMKQNIPDLSSYGFDH